MNEPENYYRVIFQGLLVLNLLRIPWPGSNYKWVFKMDIIKKFIESLKSEGREKESMSRRFQMLCEIVEKNFKVYLETLFTSDEANEMAEYILSSLKYVQEKYKLSLNSNMNFYEDLGRKNNEPQKESKNIDLLKQPLLEKI
jgi:hypothetical protein